MPIKFACPHCQHAIEASRRHVGHRVECPSCKQPIVVPGAEASQAAAPTPPEPEEIELEEVGRPAGRRRSGRGGFVSVIAPPRGALGLLWLGLLLVMLSFTIKHLFVDVSITSVPGVFEYPRLVAKKQAEKFPLYDEVKKIEEEISESERGRFDDAFEEGGRDAFREWEERRDRQRKRLNDARDKADDAAKKIDEKYEEELRAAELAAIESGAAGLGWLQRGIWLKVLVDLPKLLGCFLIVFAAMPIVSDPEQQAPVKAYAIACSTVVLVYATLYAALAFFS
ncbi:MAG: hypothetical protein ACE37H_13365 [Phycisphaeraceae bacterium]